MFRFIHEHCDQDERRIMRIASVGILVGVVALYIISVTHEAPVVTATELDYQDVGEFVRLHGVVHDAAMQDGTLFVTLQEDTFPVVYFQYTGAVPKEGASIVAKGEVQRYEGELEVIARALEINASDRAA